MGECWNNSGARLVDEIECKIRYSKRLRPMYWDNMYSIMHG